jgi:hypothetical protein
MTGINNAAEILSRGAIVEKELRKVSLKDVPLSAVMICTTSEPLLSTPPVSDMVILDQAVTTSEIFRLCSIIYVFRVCRGDSVPLDDRTQEAWTEVNLLRFNLI